MKLLAQLFATLTLALAMLGQAAIATDNVFSEDRCSIPTVPGIDISNVKIVKNISSRDRKVEQYIWNEHKDALSYRGSVSYIYNKVDLDGDGRPEVLLRVSSSFCGTGGCPTDILKLKGDRYTMIDSSLSFGRFIVTSNRTNGFKDIFYPYFIRNENKYLLQKASKNGQYKTFQEYDRDLKVKGTAYLVCGKELFLSK